MALKDSTKNNRFNKGSTKNNGFKDNTKNNAFKGQYQEKWV